MLLRCSICKGQFEIEPFGQKTTVFCSHCGAPLDLRTKPKQLHTPGAPVAAPGRSAAAVNPLTQAPSAPSASESLESLLAPPPAPAAPPPAPRRVTGPIRPAGPTVALQSPREAVTSDPADPLAALAISTQTAGPPRKALQRKAKQQQGVNTAIVVIIITLLVAGVIILVVWGIHSYMGGGAELPPEPVRHDPGEMFPHVPTTPTRTPEPAPPADQ